MRACTVAIPVSTSGKLLLGKRVKPGFGCGFLAGFGGKVKEGESVDSAAARELSEETGLDANNCILKQCGVVDFTFAGQEVLDFRLYIYRCDLSDEIDAPLKVAALGLEHANPLEWHDAPPYERMWPDAAIWLGLVLTGQPPFHFEIQYKDPSGSGMRVKSRNIPKHGLGKPLEKHLDWLQSVARGTNDPPRPLKLNFRPHPLLGYEGEFLSPCRTFLPEESARGRVWVVEPSRRSQNSVSPVVVHLAATGDHRWYTRYLLFARQLAREGVIVALLENPFYGRRRPRNQFGAKLNTVHDLASMGRATAEECAALLSYFKSRGHESLCSFGVSQGGLHAAMAASLCAFPVNVVSALAPPRAAPVFTAGCLSSAVAWSAFGESEIHSRKTLASHLNSVASIGLFPPPKVPGKHVLLVGTDDEYVRRDVASEWKLYRPDIVVKYVPGGHLTAVALRSSAIRQAVLDTLYETRAC